jgi:hypothetical protein
MDNMHQPPGGDPQDSRSTEQFWPMHNVTSGRPGHGAPGPGYPHPQSPPDARQHFAADRRRALHWTIGLTAAVLLAAGGVLAGLSLTGNSPPAGTASPAANLSSAGGPGAQAAALSTTLASADSPGTLTLPASASGNGSAGSSLAGTAVAAGTTGTAAGTTADHPCRTARQAARAARKAGNLQAAKAARKAAPECFGYRHRLIRVSLLRGIDGQFTIRTAHGVRTLAFERGVIQSVSSSNIVVRATDGTTWTWDLVSSTVVREHGTKTQRSALSTGQPVWVGGPVVSGAKDARLIMIRPPAGSSPAPSPSASPSASAS